MRARAAALALGAGGCGGGDDALPAPLGAKLLDAARGGALTVTPSGDLLVGELETGVIVVERIAPGRAGASGRVRAAPTSPTAVTARWRPALSTGSAGRVVDAR